LSGDRRRYERTQRLIRLRFDWGGGNHFGVTTDLSFGGAFINTGVYPPPGTVLDFVYDPTGQGQPIIFTAVVQRVVDPLSRISVVPGIGIRWLQAMTHGSAESLSRLLTSLFKQEVGLELTPDGRVIWRPEHDDPADTPEFKRTRHAQVRDDLSKLDRIVAPVAEKPLDRRSAPRFQTSTEVTVYVNRLPLNGRVRNISLRGLWVEAEGFLPRVGDVVTTRYPIEHKGEDRWVRLVGVVIRTRPAPDSGFGLEIIRVDNLGVPALFEDYIDHLAQAQSPDGNAPRTLDERPFHTVNSDGTTVVDYS